MPIAKITGQGLTAMALSVALLWTALVLQHFSQRRAAEERREVMREIVLRQRHERPEPVSVPFHVHRSLRPAQG